MRGRSSWQRCHGQGPKTPRSSRISRMRGRCTSRSAMMRSCRNRFVEITHFVLLRLGMTNYCNIFYSSILVILECHMKYFLELLFLWYYDISFEGKLFTQTCYWLHVLITSRHWKQHGPRWRRRRMPSEGWRGSASTAARTSSWAVVLHSVVPIHPLMKLKSNHQVV